MKLRVLVSESEQRRGVLGLAKLDPEEVFFFPHVGAGSWFHMRGVAFAIEIGLLDRDFKLLAIERLEPETGLLRTPPRTCHAAEAATGYFAAHGLGVGACWLELHAAVAERLGARA